MISQGLTVAAAEERARAVGPPEVHARAQVEALHLMPPLSRQVEHLARGELDRGPRPRVRLAQGGEGPQVALVRRRERPLEERREARLLLEPEQALSLRQRQV